MIKHTYIRSLHVDLYVGFGFVGNTLFCIQVPVGSGNF